VAIVHKRVEQRQQRQEDAGDGRMNNADATASNSAGSGKGVENKGINQREQSADNQVNAESGQPGPDSERETDQRPPHHGEVKDVKTRRIGTAHHDGHERRANNSRNKAFDPSHGVCRQILELDDTSERFRLTPGLLINRFVSGHGFSRAGTLSLPKGRALIQTKPISKCLLFHYAARRG
jgi:hypothetical protein